MPAVYFFHLAVYFAQIILLCHEIFLGKFYHNTNQSAGHWKNHQGNQRHNRANAKHHNKNPYDSGCRRNQLGNALVQALPQRIHIIGNSGKHIPYCPGFKVFQRHPVDFPGNLIPETVTELLGNACHNPPLDKRQACAKNIDTQQNQKDSSYLIKSNPAVSGYFCHQTMKNLRGSLAQYFRPQNLKSRSPHRKKQYRQQSIPVSPHIPKKPSRTPFKIFCLFPWHHMSARTMAMHPARPYISIAHSR